ncbi:signal peptidase I [Flavobacterium piscis]|uniref:Signal peptidase I n=1 Tax=Flavobacterium piscis TaxID=1114874 RepID=A0ABU1Y3Q1_9FLAO|nr:signal peptidase I [Flavobacterium piscis]MDR7208849.1 signal peptidase I [Flavobacterium piscis]
MTLYLWFVFFLAVQIIHFLGTWKLYQAAGRKSWEAAIPVYNSIVLMKIIGRPTWWTFLLFIPIINLIMFPVVWVETLRTFGKKSTLDTILGIFTFGFYIYYINYTQKLEHNPNRKLTPENKTADTINSLLFAIIVATLVHTYVVQPFTIPTSSLEKSLLIGDFLFVSKVNYGPRVPMTTVALPMVHDSIPLTKKKSYLSWPQLPYFRLPALEKIKNNDIVVFNWPVDTVHYFFEPKGRPGVIKPIDKKSNYVKRCVGIPGDNLSIKDGFVFINGKKLVLPERAKPQYEHTIYAAKGISNELLKETGSTEFSRTYIIKPTSDAQLEAVRPYIIYANQNPDNSFTIQTGFNGLPANIIQTTGIYAQEQYLAETNANLTLKAADELRKNKAIDSIIQYVEKKHSGTEIFPHNGKWTMDEYGPILIPKAGATVQLNSENIGLYARIIGTYENNKLEIKDNQIKINGELANSYTFTKDYYWMMGDNRHHSEDSRYWGFVPSDHIVGKPVFIWLSWDTNGKGINKIRWDRVFTTVDGEGQPQSYFKYFLIILAAYFIGEYFWRKRKESKQ